MCILTSVASVPVRAKCYASPASEDSGRAKIGARAPILSHFCSLPNFRATRIFTSTQHISLRSHRWERLLRRLCVFWSKDPSTSVFVWKGAELFLWGIGLPSTRIRWKRWPKKQLFENALQRGDFWSVRVDVENMMTSQRLMSPKNDCVGGKRRIRII